MTRWVGTINRKSERARGLELEWGSRSVCERGREPASISSDAKV